MVTYWQGNQRISGISPGFTLLALDRSQTDLEAWAPEMYLLAICCSVGHRYLWRFTCSRDLKRIWILIRSPVNTGEAVHGLPTLRRDVGITCWSSKSECTAHCSKGHDYTDGLDNIRDGEALPQCRRFTLFWRSDRWVFQSRDLWESGPPLRYSGLGLVHTVGWGSEVSHLE